MIFDLLIYRAQQWRGQPRTHVRGVQFLAQPTTCGRMGLGWQQVGKHAGAHEDRSHVEAHCFGGGGVLGGMTFSMTNAGIGGGG